MSQRTDIDRLAGVMLAEFARLHERFDRLDPRLDTIDGRLSDIGRELGDVMRRLDHLDAQIGDIRGYAKEICSASIWVRRRRRSEWMCGGR